MQRNNHESYFVAVRAYVAGDTAQTLQFLKGSEGSLAEKALIEARLAMKRNDYVEAQSLLDRTHPNTSLLLGERFFLQAALVSYKSKWQEAVLFAMHALSEYRASENSRGLFLSNYNLSVYYQRLGLDELSFYFLNEAELYAQTPSQKVLVSRARACEFSRMSDFKSALHHLEIALRSVDKLDDVDSAHLRAVAGDIFFRAGDHHRALLSLNELQRCKTLPDKARAKFDLTLLSALNAKLDVFVPSSCPEVIQQNFEYRTKWNIVSALQNGEWERANTEWAQLATAMANRYLPNFNVVSKSDEKTIFITVIRILLARVRPAKEVSKKLHGKQALLFEALSKSKVPPRKEELIEKIWNCEYSPDLDARFYKLVERFRASTGLEIEVIRHTYRIK